MLTNMTYEQETRYEIPKMWTDRQKKCAPKQVAQNIGAPISEFECLLAEEKDKERFIC